MTTSTRWKWLAATLLVIVAAAPAARADTGEHTGDHWPQLVSGSGEQGWESFKIDAVSGQIAFQIHGGGFTSPMTFGIAIYDGDENFIQAAAFTAYYARIGYRIHTTAGPEGPVTMQESFEEYSHPSGGGGFTPVIAVNGRSTLKVVIWAAARQLEDWSYSVRAQDAELLAQDSGPDAFIYMTDDFTGVAQLHANALGGVRTSVALGKSVVVKDRLFAWYLQPFVSGCCQVPLSFLSPNANHLSATTPAGERICALGCDFFRESENAGPGLHTFHVTGAGASPISSGDDVTLTGVDARLPN